MNQTGSERRGTGLGWAGALRASCLMAWMMTLMLAGTAHALSPGQQAAAEQAAQAAKPAAAPMLKSELQQFLVTVEKGETVFKPVGEVKPGDLIEYRAVYTNVGKAAVSEVVVDLPIPEATEYQPRTARPAGVLAAVVGRNFAPEPLMDLKAVADAVLFMAGLASFPAEISEAAKLDGASETTIFWKMKLPHLKGTMRTAIVLSVIGALRYFDLIYVMTGGGPEGSSELMATYMYRNVFSSFQLGYGSTVASGMFIVVILIASVLLRFSKRYETEV